MSWQPDKALEIAPAKLVTEISVEQALDGQHLIAKLYLLRERSEEMELGQHAKLDELMVGAYMLVDLMLSDDALKTAFQKDAFWLDKCPKVSSKNVCKLVAKFIFGSKPPLEPVSKEAADLAKKKDKLAHKKGQVLRQMQTEGVAPENAIQPLREREIEKLSFAAGNEARAKREAKRNNKIASKGRCTDRPVHFEAELTRFPADMRKLREALSDQESVLVMLRRSEKGLKVIFDFANSSPLNPIGDAKLLDAGEEEPSISAALRDAAGSPSDATFVGDQEPADVGQKPPPASAYGHRPVIVRPSDANVPSKSWTGGQ